MSIAIGVAGTAALLVGGTPRSSAAPALTIHGSGPGCSVNLVITPPKARIDVVSGCSGPGYWLSSWITQSGIRSSVPQQLFDESGNRPWSVDLPSCYYQIDFANRTAAPGQRSTKTQEIVFYLGGSACQVTTTTAPGGSTSTTSPRGVTTTTQPGGGTTTTTQPGGGTTTTTCPDCSGSTTSTTATTTPRGGGGTTTTTCPTCGGGTTTSTGPGGGGTTTTAANGPHTAAGGGSPGSPSPAQASTPAKASNGALAFTGFMALMFIFIACTMIGCGIAIVRAGRGVGSAGTNG